MNLTDKVVVVTGGAKNIGLTIARLLMQKNAKVVILDKDDLALKEASKQLKHSHETILCDVTNTQKIQAAIETIIKKYASIHVLINNAGILYSEPLVSWTKEGIKMHNYDSWNRIITHNLTSAFLLTRVTVCEMLKLRVPGVIVNISSVSAQGNSGQSAYSAAKAGLEALTKVWAKELAPIGIRCFAVAPGFINTPSTEQALNTAILKQITQNIPLKRLGKPEDVANMVIAGIENDYINGTILHVDGGITL